MRTILVPWAARRLDVVSVNRAFFADAFRRGVALPPLLSSGRRYVAFSLDHPAVASLLADARYWAEAWTMPALLAGRRHIPLRARWTVSAIVKGQAALARARAAGKVR